MKTVILDIYVDKDHPELLEMYKTHIQKHNSEVEFNHYPNAGFDLFIPNDVEFVEPFQTKMVDLFVKTQMWEYSKDSNNEERSDPTGYYLYPRSSIAKTQLILANHVGVIDSGYRNNLLCAFRYLPLKDSPAVYKIENGVRLVQICHPSLMPIFVRLSTNPDDFKETNRLGGFGSTGGTV